MKLLYKLLVFILALFIYSPANSITPYSTSKENAEFVFTVFSDVHMEGNNKEKFTLSVRLSVMLILPNKITNLYSLVTTP